MNRRAPITETMSMWHLVRMDLERLADVDLIDADENHYRLGDFWADRPVILVFLRHFG